MTWANGKTFGAGEGGLGPTEVLILKYMGLGFALAGVAMLLGSLWMYSNTRRFLAVAESTTGEVTSLVRRQTREGVTFAPTVRFRTLRGKVFEFVSATSSNPPGYAVGDAVGVLYNPVRPGEATIRGFFPLWGGTVILGGIAVPFTATGSILLAIYRKVGIDARARSRAREEREGLRLRGRRVEAKFLEVRSEPPGSYRIVSQWHDPSVGKVYVYESDDLGYDPSDLVTSTIPVFVDTQDPGRYLVDTSSLPSLGSAPGCVDLRPGPFGPAPEIRRARRTTP